MFVNYMINRNDKFKLSYFLLIFICLNILLFIKFKTANTELVFILLLILVIIINFFVIDKKYLKYL